jgi:predicted ATPase/DNA-binding NarL/FixJ family response regulator
MTADGARLPAEFTSFVGRADEVASLAGMLRAGRALTLCGAGGIGKTRLALRLLAGVRADFPDGIWFVDIGELTQPQLVVSAVAAAIGVHEEPGRPLADTLADAVRHRQGVLALDNCEHLVAACARLCQLLLASAPGLRIMTTSREPLHVAAETVWQVPPLRLPPAEVTDPAQISGSDAVRLFAERAEAAAPGFTVGAANALTVARICRSLDGLPLAIELAAAWVRALSADQIAARIGNRFVLLTGADRSAPARQLTLRAAIDWSYNLLAGPEQMLLRRLSVFSEWSLEMAEEICADQALPADDVLDLITSLADKSLLEVGPDVVGQARYRLLETVREYAASWLAEAGEAGPLRDRRRAFAVREVEELLAVGMGVTPAGWDARVDVFRRFDAESGNVHEVLGECLARGDAETGLRLCRAMTPVMIVRGTFSHGAEWLDAFFALEQARTVPDSVGGPALVARAQLALASGSPRAAGFALAGLERSRGAGNEFCVAAALNVLTEIALHAGQPDEAIARGTEALALARAAGDRWNEGYALGTLAAVAAGRGNLREAEELTQAALTAMRAIEQHWGSARALLGLGDLARGRGDHDTARQHYREALAYLRPLSSRPDIARCLAGLGRIDIDQGDLAAARTSLTESARLSYVSGSRIGMARGLEALARLAGLEGRPDTGLRLAAAVAALREEAQLPPVPGARMQRYLDAAAELGPHAIGRLWADGAALTPAAALELAVSEPGRPGPQLPPAGGPAAVPPRASPESLALTGREREVVDLIAAGKSNRDIGTELFISPATAARHVANILAKLGFTSRSQVAVWARSADLGALTPASSGPAAGDGPAGG